MSEPVPLSDCDDEAYLVPKRFSSSPDRRIYFVPLWQAVSVSGGDTSGRRAVLCEVSNATSKELRSADGLGCSDIFLILKKGEPQDVVDEDNVEYAFVSGEMWKQACGPRNACSVAEVGSADVYSLQLRVSALQDSNSLGMEISNKDNIAERFRRACKTFNADYELMRIWDFSGSISSLMKHLHSLPRDSQWNSDHQVTAGGGQIDTIFFSACHCGGDY